MHVQPKEVTVLKSHCLYIQVLVDAVEDRAGGNHKVLAKKISSAPLGKF